MMSNRPVRQDWPENMRPALAAEYLGISTSKLAKLRMAANRQFSPPFIKLSGCVIYRRDDLDAWLERHVVGSSNEVHVNELVGGGSQTPPLRSVAPREIAGRMYHKRAAK